MRLKLTSAYGTLHRELHQRGHFHEHSPVTDHDEHSRVNPMVALRYE